jgi:hypothetical protein
VEMPLRQGLDTSGRPFILIAPTLGADADTEFGNLGKRIDDYLDLMMTHLYELGPPEYALPSPPKIGDLIVTGHSGGFGPIRSILSNISRYKQNIKEIWVSTSCTATRPSPWHQPGFPCMPITMTPRGIRGNWPGDDYPLCL